jgi:hypothetical protein
VRRLRWPSDAHDHARFAADRDVVLDRGVAFDDGVALDHAVALEPGTDR